MNANGTDILAKAARTLGSAILLMLLVGLIAPARVAAEDLKWTVQAVSGDAEMTTDFINWEPLSIGAVIVPGTEIETGVDGRIILSTSGDNITVSPNSRMAVPVENPGEDIANIEQTLGTALYKIESTPGRSFKVKTPYLVAGVKGTTFTVTVGVEGAAISLIEGLVEAIAVDIGATELLVPGETAVMSSEPGSELIVLGREEAVETPAAPAPPSAPTEDEGSAPAGEAEDAPAGEAEEAPADDGEESPTGESEETPADPEDGETSEGAAALEEEAEPVEVEEEASEAASEASKEAGQAASEASKEAGKAASEASKEAGKAASEASKEAGKAASEDAKEVAKAAEEAAKEAEKAAEEATKAAEEAAIEATKAAEEAAIEAVKAAEEAVKVAAKAAEEAGDDDD